MWVLKYMYFIMTNTISFHICKLVIIPCWIIGTIYARSLIVKRMIELLLQAGAFYPFFRAHAHLDTKRREPYLLPEDNMKVIRDAVRTRYTLLSYMYTQFYKSVESGSPIFQPMWVEFPEETAIFGIDDQFMLGKRID